MWTYIYTIIPSCTLIFTQLWSLDHEGIHDIRGGAGLWLEGSSKFKGRAKNLAKGVQILFSPMLRVCKIKYILIVVNI